MKKPAEIWVLTLLETAKELYQWPHENGAGLTPLQEEVFLDVVRHRYRMAMILGGERGGKSFLLALLMACFAGPVDEDGREYKNEMYWLVGPDYRQTRPEFTYIYELYNQLGLIEIAAMPENPNSPWSMVTNWGTRIETRTSSDATKLASFAVHGAGMCEASQQEHGVMLKLQGRSSQTRGFVYMAGTLEKGLPWYASTFRKWQRYDPEMDAKSFKLPTWSNLAAYPGGEEDPEIIALKRNNPPDYFAERYGAEPQSRYGLVVPEFEPVTHIVDIVPMSSTQPVSIGDGQMPFYTDMPVHMFYDPGKHCAALWFAQIQGKMTVFLDSVYIRDVLVQDFIPEVKKSPYWDYAKNSTGHVADIAVNQHHHNKSVAVIWYEETGLRWNSTVIKEEKWTWDVWRYRLSVNNNYGVPLVYFSSRNIMPEPTPDGWAPAALTEFMLWKYPDRVFNPMSSASVRPIDANNDAVKAGAYGLIYYFGVNQELSARRSVHKRSYYREYQRKPIKKTGEIRLGVRI